jgi:hypothetical protein
MSRPCSDRPARIDIPPGCVYGTEGVDGAASADMAQMVLMAADGLRNDQIAARVTCQYGNVCERANDSSTAAVRSGCRVAVAKAVLRAAPGRPRGPTPGAADRRLFPPQVRAEVIRLACERPSTAPGSSPAIPTSPPRPAGSSTSTPAAGRVKRRSRPDPNPVSRLPAKQHGAWDPPSLSWR